MDANFNWDNLQAQIAKEATDNGRVGYQPDQRFWKLTRDENDNGSAIIRLMPSKDGQPWVKVYSFSISSYSPSTKKNSYFIEDSRISIGEECPVQKLWEALWRSNDPDGKNEAKCFARKTAYIANIKVLKDPSKKEAEGKIFLWQFGQKLHQKFMSALNPTEQDLALGMTPKELFNPLKGNNILLRAAKEDGYINYNGTQIQDSSSVYESKEAAIEDINNNGYELSEFQKSDHFLTYEEMERRFLRFLKYYTPKFMNPISFKAIVQSVFGDKIDKDTKAAVSDTTNTEKSENDKKVQKEISAASTEKTNPVDDLAFLDDLV